MPSAPVPKPKWMVKSALGTVEKKIEQENLKIGNNNNYINNTHTRIHCSTINNHWEYRMRLAREMKSEQLNGIVSFRLLNGEPCIRYIIQQNTLKNVMPLLFFVLRRHFIFLFIYFVFVFVSVIADFDVVVVHFVVYYFILFCDLVCTSSRRMVEYVIHLNDNAQHKQRVQ